MILDGSPQEGVTIAWPIRHRPIFRQAFFNSSVSAAAKIGGYEGKSDAGIIFLGNIAQDNMDEYQNMFSELPSLFQESACILLAFFPVGD